MHGLKLAGIELDRKVLAETATADAAQFALIIEQVKAALGRGTCADACPRAVSPNQSSRTQPMATTALELDADSLGHLEERIQQTVALVTRLRGEKESALKQLAETKSALDDATNQNLQLTEELESMKDEKKQVRSRIEKLLGHIDNLGTA